MKNNHSYPVNSDSLSNPKNVAVVERWLLFRDHLCNKISKLDLGMVIENACGRFVKVIVGSDFECTVKLDYNEVCY